MNKVKALYLLAVASVFTFFSCDKNEKVEPVVDKPQIAASVLVDLANESDFKMAMQLANENASYKNSTNTSIKTVIASCPIITLELPTSNPFPKIFHVDFGTDCLTNGISKNGKLKITLTDYLSKSGSKMKIEREEYYIKGIKVEGTADYVNVTTNANTPEWTRTVTNGKITNLEGIVFFNSGTHTLKQTIGVATFSLDDNVYLITKGFNIVSRETGTSLTITILEPLIKRYSCEYISKGKLQFKGTILNGALDYGNDTCDNLVTYIQQSGELTNFNL